MILADDLTGAMDSGVQFAKLGIRTRVLRDAAAIPAASGEAAVLVVDTETRHLPPGEAGRLVYEAVRLGREAGIPNLFKKTDSALRGNVGAELSAALGATGAPSVPFVPAYPQMGRVTKNGIHYIGDVPVSESAFGKDPFSPVLRSDVVQWLATQSTAPVVRAGETVPSEPYIEVFDARTEEDLEKTARALKAEGRLSLLAGCAGMASVLPGALGLETGAAETVISPGRLCVLCGSVHPVTREQIAFAVSQGARRVRLTPAQKLGKDGENSPAHRHMVALTASLCREEAPVIVDANDEGSETLAYAASLGMGLPQVRAAVSAALGKLGRELLMAGVDSTLLVTGGDTLLGFLNAYGKGVLRPVGELAPGIVRARFEAEGKAYDMITKSGGFGEKQLLAQLAGQMKSEKGDKT